MTYEFTKRKISEERAARRRRLAVIFATGAVGGAVGAALALAAGDVSGMIGAARAAFSVGVAAMMAGLAASVVTEPAQPR